jgi:hypothetical protein
MMKVHSMSLLYRHTLLLVFLLCLSSLMADPPEGETVKIFFKNDVTLTGTFVMLPKGANKKADFALEYEFEGEKKRIPIERNTLVYYQVQKIRYPSDKLIAVSRGTGGMSLALPKSLAIVLDKEEAGFEELFSDSKAITVDASFSDFKREKETRGKPLVEDGKYQFGKFNKATSPLEVPEISLSIEDPYSQRFLLDLGENVVPVVVLPHTGAATIGLDDTVSFIPLTDWDRLMNGEKFNLRVNEVPFGMLRIPTATENRDWNILTEKARDIDRKNRAALINQTNRFNEVLDVPTAQINGSEINGIAAFRKLAELVKPPESEPPSSPQSVLPQWMINCLKWTGMMK